jgi:hypothetical protein
MLRVAQDVDGAVTMFAWDWAGPDTVGRVPEMLSDGDKRYLVGHDTLGSVPPWMGTSGRRWMRRRRWCRGKRRSKNLLTVQRV